MGTKWYKKFPTSTKHFQNIWSSSLKRTSEWNSPRTSFIKSQIHHQKDHRIVVMVDTATCTFVKPECLIYFPKTFLSLVQLHYIPYHTLYLQHQTLGHTPFFLSHLDFSSFLCLAMDRGLWVDSHHLKQSLHSLEKKSWQNYLKLLLRVTNNSLNINLKIKYNICSISLLRRRS